jgi:hypothetical protein
MGAATIDELVLADTAAAWGALGFAVSGDECRIGAVRLRFAGPRPAGEEQAPPTDATRSGHEPATSGLIGWSLRGIDSAELDGLPTRISERPPPASGLQGEPANALQRGPIHPNGVLAIDHVVAISPAFERSVAALQAAGLDLRRVREQPTPAGAPRQAFFRLGHEILELVAEPDHVTASSPEGERDGGAQRPSRFWGLALLVEDLERTAQQLAPHVGEVRDAVQPGRRIATVRRSAGLSLPIALMSPKQQEVPA